MRTIAMLILAAAALLTGVQAWAQHSVSVQADGSVVISTEEERFVIPAPVAGEIELAVRELADDPETLRQAIRDIISRNAGDSGAAGLATAIAAFAVLQAGSDSSLIAAIGLGVTQGNSDVPGAAVIAAIPALRSAPSPEETEQRELDRAQATVENPAQVSPVQ